MGKTFREIFSQLIKKRGLKTGSEVARAIGISQQQVSRYLSEKIEDNPKLDTAVKISRALGVSLDFLAGIEEAKPDEVPPGGYLRIPIVESKLAAGNPALITSENIIDHAYVQRRAVGRASTRSLLCTHIRGDSMHPVLRDGATVCIDLLARPDRKRVPASSIWAIRKDEGAVVKYLQIQDNTLVLISENKLYPVELVRDSEAIIGRVVWIWQAV